MQCIPHKTCKNIFARNYFPKRRQQTGRTQISTARVQGHQFARLGSFWSSHAIWRRKSLSSLVQVKACCLTASRPTAPDQSVYHARTQVWNPPFSRILDEKTHIFQPKSLILRSNKKKPYQSKTRFYFRHISTLFVKARLVCQKCFYVHCISHYV